MSWTVSRVLSILKRYLIFFKEYIILLNCDRNRFFKKSSSEFCVFELSR